MSIKQIEVHLTSDGLGRAAVAQCQDGRYCVYVHWIWAASTRDAFKLASGGRTSWKDDRTPLADLYEDIAPEPGSYETLGEAQQAIHRIPGFADASINATGSTAR